eukprot:PhF_6_TR13006/c0_g1_i1/m.20601/K00058/serA, PHGDH; D-3-phosphoglycerate dehydrogenase / 2-oxoglutarate reductase
MLRRFSPLLSLPLIVKNDITLDIPNTIRDLTPHARFVHTPDDEEETNLKHISDASILLTCYAKVTERIINSAPKLKGIVKYGVGIDQIDTVAAKKKGVVVVNVPQYAENTVAEMAFALMIDLMKKLHVQQLGMQKEWLWPNTERWLGYDLEGKTIGIVGLGLIGSSFARMCKGFLMNVIAYDPYRSEEYFAARGVKKVSSMEDLVTSSDIVAMHSVLNSETRHILSRDLIAKLKPSAIVINTARGALIDEVALVDALVEKRVAAAGLDVFSQEPVEHSGHPMSQLYPLVNEGRVLLTPHLAFYTKEAMKRLEDETTERCLEILQDRPVLVKSKDPRLQGQSKCRYL